MAKITDPDNLYYSEYTYGSSIDPTTAQDGQAANMLIDYENKKFALTAPRFGVIAAGLSSEMVGYGDTGGVTGQALYSKFKNIWKTDPVAIRFPFPMEAITPESFEFINGWLPDDVTVSTQSGVNTSFITRKLIKDTGWAERSAAGLIQRKYFGCITLGAIAIGPSGFGTVYYNPTDPGIQTSFVVDTSGSVHTATNAVVFNGPVGNENTLSGAAYFYTGDAVVYQTDSNNDAITGITHNEIYYISYQARNGVGAKGVIPVGVGHSFTLHETRTDAIAGINTIALTGSTAGRTARFTAAAEVSNFFFGVSLDGGAANEPFQFYGTKDDDGTNIIYNKDDYFKIFTREEGKTYSDQNLAQIGVSQLNYQAYRLPLSSGSDVNVSILDSGATGIATAGYAGIGISFHQSPVSYEVGGVSYNFNIVIDANSQPLQAVYSKVNYLLRQPGKILAGAGVTNINDLSAIPNGGTAYDNDFRYGQAVPPLLEFVGNDLYVRRVEDVFGDSGSNNLGVFINNVRNADLNNVYFYDNNAIAGSSAIFYPFLAQGNLVFNDNFIGDGDAKFWMFYDLDAVKPVPGLSSSFSRQAGTGGVTSGIIDARDEFVCGAGASHPFVHGQRVVCIFPQSSTGIGLSAVHDFDPATDQGLTTSTYYVNTFKDVARTLPQTYADINETGTNTPASPGNRIGVGATDRFRLHVTYADAVANNNLGINTIALTPSGTAGIITFRQIDINYSEANATIVQKEDGVFIDGIAVPGGGSYEFTYDYDKNSQRNRIPSGGADASNTYAPNVRVVAVGLQTGQYASATAQITRSKGQTINVTGALERVYSDPV